MSKTLIEQIFEAYTETAASGQNSDDQAVRFFCDFAAKWLSDHPILSTVTEIGTSGPLLVCRLEGAPDVVLPWRSSTGQLQPSQAISISRQSGSPTQSADGVRV